MMHTHARTHMHAYMHTHARTRMYTHTHTHTHTCARAHTRTHTHTQEHSLVLLLDVESGELAYFETESTFHLMPKSGVVWYS